MDADDMIDVSTDPKLEADGKDMNSEVEAEVGLVGDGETDVDMVVVAKVAVEGNAATELITGSAAPEPAPENQKAQTSGDMDKTQTSY